MSGLYKTPGVYVEEIPKFPPSIAAVETAIPAFIGYTEKAIKNGEDISQKPTRIESIAEYELLFGGAPPQDVEVVLDGSNNFVRASANTQFYLFDSLRMFYANGGGKCYIVSVGNYNVPPGKSNFLSGLDKLKMEDEPTILLFPDAAGLSTDDLCDIQKEALMQSANLKDRVVMCDLSHGVDFNDNVQDFRDKIGINNLKYGAAYGPWINASLPHILLRRNLILKSQSGAALSLGQLTTDDGIKKLIEELELAESGVDAMPTSETTISGAGNRIQDKLNELIVLYNKSDDSTAEGAIQAITTLIIDIILAAKDRFDAAPNPGVRFKLRDDITSYLTSSGISAIMQDMADHHIVISATPSTLNLLIHGSLSDAESFLGFDSATAVIDYSADYTGLTDKREIFDVAYNSVKAAAGAAISLFRFVESTQKSYEKGLNDALLAAFGLYKEIMTKAGAALNLLPPSGAVAGIYAATDRDRGVWKAPANVSLNAVINPAVKITHEQQGEYNIDVNAGKSINIIREFTGKGTLVWGARTLAGNDNEWRYVNVRRFFNFVEESVKKATEQFVFEPNDINTWIRVQAMIENFLNTLWRQGALQGIKPEHAFYVAVGLGKTMTALDILEGRMIIEIGMAAVRPAEFIVLRFSHKMAES